VFVDLTKNENALQPILERCSKMLSEYKTREIKMMKKIKEQKKEIEKLKSMV